MSMNYDTMRERNTHPVHISRRTFLIGSTHLAVCMAALASGYRTVAAAGQEAEQIVGYGVGAYGCGIYAGGNAQVSGVYEQFTAQSVNSIYLPIVAQTESNQMFSSQSNNKIYLPIVTKENN